MNLFITSALNTVHVRGSFTLHHSVTTNTLIVHLHSNGAANAVNAWAQRLNISGTEGERRIGSTYTYYEKAPATGSVAYEFRFGQQSPGNISIANDLGGVSDGYIIAEEIYA